MKKLIVILVVILILIPFYFLGRKYFLSKPYALRINNFTMTEKELADYFKKMLMNEEDTPEARRKVLDLLINKKLVLQEAEKEGLHMSEEFLNALQEFYEQLLFKMIIDKKSKELGAKVSVSDQEVKARYEELQKKGVVTQPLEEVFDKLKWQIFREKQTQALNNWLEELRKKAKIQLDEDILNK